MTRLLILVAVLAAFFISSPNVRSQPKESAPPAPKDNPDERKLSLLGMVSDLATATPLYGSGIPGLECFPVFAKSMKNEAPPERIAKYAGFPDEIVKKLRSDNCEDRLAAVECLSNYASIIRSFSQELNDDGDDVVRVAFGKYAQPIRQSLETLLPKATDKERAHVAALLLMLDPAHAAAIDAFVKELRADDQERRIPALVLAGVARLAQPDVIAGLVGIMKSDQNFIMRGFAAGAIKQIGPKAGSAVPTLIELLRCGVKANAKADIGLSSEEKEKLRDIALSVLCDMGAEARQAVPIIQDMLQKAPDEKCVELIDYLVRIGPDAKGAAPTIRRRLQAKDVDIRQTAAAALLCFDPADAEATKILVAGLRSESKETKQSALENCIRFGPKAKTLVPVLVALLKDDKCTDFAGSALGRMGPAAEEAIPALFELLTDAKLESEVHRAAGWGLRGIGKASIPSLVKLLDNAEYRHFVHDTAAMALGDFGQDAAVALPALVRMLERNDGYYDRVAAATLGRLRKTAAPARAALQQAVQSQDNYVAAWALTQLDR